MNALYESEILDASTDGIAMINREWTVRYVNRAGKAILGPNIDAVGKNHWETFPEMLAEGSPFARAYYAAMDEGLASEFVTFYGGSLDIWVSIRVTPATDGIIVYFRDITTQKELQDERDAASARMTEILAATTDGIGLIGRDWRFLFLNQRGHQITRATDDVVGLDIWERFPSMVYPDSPYTYHYHRAMDERISAQFVVSYPDPEPFWVQINVQPVSAGILVVFRDVTAESNLEHERSVLHNRVQASVDRLRLAQASGNIASWEWDLAKNTFTWDGGSSWVYGRSPAEMTGFDQIVGYLHEEDRQKTVLAIQTAAREGSDYQAEFRVHWPDGSLHWISASAHTVRSPQGEPLCMVGVNIDVTQRKQAELALMQSEKLAAVGRLASTIAHEINNPLEAVTNLIYIARHSDSLEEARTHLALADRELSRAAAITNQTLRFHKQSTRPTRVTFADLANGLFTGMHSRLLNARVTLEQRDRATLALLCLEGEIRQVLTNLVANAIDAIHGRGGKLLLRCRNGQNWRSNQSGLVITVADTGCGISESSRQKLFDAFYTTKGMGGTGLGLWISQEIVARHLGTMHVRSSQKTGHSGTVFTVFLPFAGIASPEPLASEP